MVTQMNILILVQTFVLGFALVTMIAFILWFDFYLCVAYWAAGPPTVQKKPSLVTHYPPGARLHRVAYGQSKVGGGLRPDPTGWTAPP